MNSHIVNHSSLGPVKITVRDSARRFIARWKDGTVHMTVPRGASPDDISGALDTLAPRLEKKRPQLTYACGQIVDLAGFKAEISRQSLKPDSILATVKEEKAYIEVGAGIDITSTDATRSISGLLCRIAGKVAARQLLPRAAMLAAELDTAPSSWKIMHGFRTLGKCTSRREIYLSDMLVFLPLEVRDYIVWHELAHLSEMSHSPRFHAICNRYCRGREKELAARLRGYPLPVLRK